MKKLNKILLIGNPNVGKSAVFSRLTGARVMVSNYPGTTVEFTQGYMKINDQRPMIIDVPGSYTLEPTSKAEEIAVEMLKEGDMVINIVDATNLERNLFLTLQLLEKDIPMIIALNLWDDTRHKGIDIDIPKLEKFLGVPVVPTSGLGGEGIKELVDKIPQARKGAHRQRSDSQRWQEIGKIVEEAQKLTHRHHTLWERIQDLSIKPLTGLPIAAGIAFVTFRLVRFIGEGLINYLLDPLFNNVYYPAISKFVRIVFPAQFLQDLLLGTTPAVMESFGLLTTGIYVPIVVVLPYIISFYLVLSILEDWGYLPHLAVLMDNIFHKIGLHGYATIPIILGLGCKVPSILATRALESRRQKVIAIALTIIVAPCLPQTAMIIALVGKYGGYYLSIIFGTLIMVGICCGIFLNKILKGDKPELIVEVPPYRLPKLSALSKKLWMRIKYFLFEAVPLIFLGVFLINIFDILGVINLLAKGLGPFLQYVLGLPRETASVLILGFLRKDISIALLEPFDLSIKQLVVASTFLVLYLPCLATFFMLLKEMGLKDTIKIMLLTFSMALAASGMLNLIMR
jgi:ferrous iron transport protein B